MNKAVEKSTYPNKDVAKKIDELRVEAVQEFDTLDWIKTLKGASDYSDEQFKVTVKAVEVILATYIERATVAERDRLLAVSHKHIQTPEQYEQIWGEPCPEGEQPNLIAFRAKDIGLEE